ncbi:MAG TPA: protoheme IX farnesyltransferase, partial [Polyangia bacterium]
PLGVAGWLFGSVAIALGIGFIASVWRGLHLGADDPASRSWARGVFFYSLIYLTALFVALAVDRIVLG